jgi:hypothetical protein
VTRGVTVRLLGFLLLADLLQKPFEVAVGAATAGPPGQEKPYEDQSLFLSKH